MKTKKFVSYVDGTVFCVMWSGDSDHGLLVA